MYKDDLCAAHERIKSLETELNQFKSKKQTIKRTIKPLTFVKNILTYPIFRNGLAIYSGIAITFVFLLVAFGYLVGSFNSRYIVSNTKIVCGEVCRAKFSSKTKALSYKTDLNNTILDCECAVPEKGDIVGIHTISTLYPDWIRSQL